MNAYARLQQKLTAEPRVWLVTGVAGFIGSHLLETLLALGQGVIGLDDFSTGSSRNLEDVRSRVDVERWARFTLQDGSVADLGACRAASRGVDFILHEAGFVSVPLSIADPIRCHETNVTGTLNLLVAARESGVRRFVFASSSAVYGDDPQQPKSETQIGRPLSPYAASKAMCEVYARLFSESFGLESVGLRYFNVFGPRQDPAGGYAAVIPRWIDAMLHGQPCLIHGDGTATRDFCHVADVVQANLLAATAPAGTGEVFNVASGRTTTLTELHGLLSREATALSGSAAQPCKYGPARAGDILHSSAEIEKCRHDLGFESQVELAAGLKETMRWFADRVADAN